MLNTYLDAMKTAAVKCGSLILDRSAIAMNINSKTSHRDVVTQYDFAVQTALVEYLSGVFPQAQFVTEETPEHNIVTDKMMFVIDPIDGTMNFVKNFHHSCISIGCLMGGMPVAAVVYDPYKQELFHAAQGMGAFLNDVPIWKVVGYREPTEEAKQKVEAFIKNNPDLFGDFRDMEER